MTRQIPDELKADVLVIGSGLAGLLLALELSANQARVIVASKGALADSNTSKAQGGLAAVTRAATGDSAEMHLQDTIKSGAGLTDPNVASLIIKEGSLLVKKLSELAVAFDRTGEGQLELALEGGHSRPRVLHCKDTTGSAISGALIDRVKADRNVIVLEHTLAIDLMVEDGNCAGARLLVSGRTVSVNADHVVLATGGIGQLFERTTNPPVATGDGIAMAWRAGAVMADLEFVQFHPTALFKPGAPAFLISEAVRGAGAILVDGQGKRFAGRFHPDGELSTRDIVARAINTVMEEQSLANVWLDLRPIGAGTIEKRFPNIVETCRRWGVDPLSEPVPVCPAAHYFMGGIWTNANGCTTLPGLYAIGECASVGLHGANRLASNSLLEAGVMALRAARYINKTGRSGRKVKSIGSSPEKQWQMPADLLALKRVMYRFAGVVRHESGLTSLFEFLSESLVSGPARNIYEMESANLLLIGQLIALAALARKESRGAHWRADYPLQDDESFGRSQLFSRSDVEERFVEGREQFFSVAPSTVFGSIQP